MNLLAIVREHARRQGLPLPTAVASSLDGYSQQCMGLLNEFCDDLNTRKLWQTNMRRAQWTAVAAESQGRLTDLAPACYEGIIPKTTFQHSQQRHMEVVSPSDWEARKVMNFVGPLLAYCLSEGEFLINPLPPAGEVFSFRYYSSAFVYFPGITGTGGAPPAYRRYFENDLDTCVVGADLAIAYLRWAWKREKGFDYAEDFVKYERMLATKSARQDSPQPVNMGDRYTGLDRPGIIIPAGSWNL